MKLKEHLRGRSSDELHTRPTLRTISELTGFAVQTVSRALGGAPDISDSTKATIRKVASEIGYVPNRAGVRLRTGKTNVIALVLSAENDVLSLTSRLISSIAKGLRGSSYNLVVMSSFTEDNPLDTVRNIVRNETADAVILNQIKPRDERVRYLMDEGFPFVTHGRTIWSERHAYYDYDNKEFGILAANQLHRKERKHILLIAPPTDQTYAIEMISGVKEACSFNGQHLEIVSKITSDSNREVIRAFTEQRFTEGTKPDGVISASPNATMAAISGIEDAGLALGETLDVFSKETVPILDLFRPNILKTREDVATAGQFLAEAAIQVADKDDKPPMQALEITETYESSADVNAISD
ncbi:MAG: LacI family transcriptional regulator [Alphaproteobacteria bacterium]